MRSLRIWPYLLLLLFLLGLFSLPRTLQGHVHALATTLFSALPITKDRHEHNQTESFMLEQENLLLKKEIARLKQQLTQEGWIEKQIERLAQIRGREVKDHGWREFFARRAQQLASRLEMQMLGIPAKVIFRDPHFWSSYVWINVGSSDNRSLGVEVIAKNSAIVVGNKLIGVIEEIEERRSKVRLLTDIQLVPAVRAIRGEQSTHLFFELTDRLLSVLKAKRGLFASPSEELQAIEALERVKATTLLAWGDHYLAKGELSGSSSPLWRSRKTLLKGAGFNYDFSDEEGPARDLRSGEAIGSPDRSPISLLNPGDLLVTSGLDGVFPSGLEVAIVTKVQILREGAASYELEAIPAITNINDLVDVWVLPPMKQSQKLTTSPT